MFIDKNTIIAGKKIWELPASPIKELHNVCRRIAAEGCVLLENKNNTLPLKKGEKVSVFGRIQNTYYKSGTGSGGLVNIEKQPCIIESLRNDGTVIIDEVLFDFYSKWIADHPFDNGTGWANEPWCQEEMPLTDELVRDASTRSDSAVIIIGRSAGEDHDNKNEAGSYLLTDKETQMIEKVTSVFKKVVVVLNVGNIIDLSFMDKYPISALIYVWQGGMEGANALADVLCGKVSPCGKLPDTQAFNITDHLSNKNFGDTTKNFYEEDIFVGYRYFETFAPKKVRYPFGFGLTYTNFEINYTAEEKNDTITVKATVTNTGNFPARETVQVYYGAPCGKLGTPQKQLAGYAKTKTLSPYESETVEIPFNIKNMASFDDSGITDNANCYVLEVGEYLIYAGTDVKNCNIVLKHNINETLVTEKLTEVMAPVENFQRYVAKQLADGTRTLEKENVPTAKSSIEDKILLNPPKNIPFTGDTGIRLIDVAEGTHTLDEFIAQMTDDDLCNIVCGEGMGSPKVTPGTGGAFGGVTDSLLNLGIPVACVTDGPSGIRLDSGAKAASLPNGTLLAATFDDVSVEEMYTLVSLELFAYNVDALLGPGMNIHRYPLNGRNFEYFSEDPLLTGKMGAAVTRGLKRTGCSSTIKHFCCNNQETARTTVEAVVSQRALREIYLKGFEIAVKEGGADCIMTAYNPVNGYWSASNYDLTTTILRGEWGFKGFVMTDWWADCNCYGEKGTKTNLKAMVRAQNDVYMVCPDASQKEHNIHEGLAEGYITRGELQRCAANLLEYIMHSPTFLRFVDGGCAKQKIETAPKKELALVCTIENITANEEILAEFGNPTPSILEFELASDCDAIAQNTLILTVDGKFDIAVTINGTNGKFITERRSLSVGKSTHSLLFKYTDPITVKSLKILA